MNKMKLKIYPQIHKIILILLLQQSLKTLMDYLKSILTKDHQKNHMELLQIKIDDKWIFHFYFDIYEFE